MSDLETSSLQIKDVNAYILGFKRHMVEKPIQIRQSNGIRASYNTHPPRDGMAQVESKKEQRNPILRANQGAINELRIL